ncbi:hypothetical protein [Mycobacterium antarcticum]|uniref:hypothetical protein n=1 Tax=unclassified Mycolicibacterium TaxID=2636767 RepID=UPI0024E1708E|nr:MULTISPECIES: hypothetical protein [unclassified Mycolicibacterium]
MSATALLVDVETAPLDEQGVVSVHLLGVGNTAARCSCGWAGRRRLLRAAAKQDAWAHAMRDRCSVSSPLVFAW